MARSAWWLVVLVACGGDGGSDTGAPTGTGDDDDASISDHPVAPCAGPHSGTYTGDISGLATADVTADGVLTVTFGTSFGSANGTADISTGGDIQGSEGSVSIEGNYDFLGCTADGNWTDTAFGTSGTWNLSRD